MSNIHSVPLTAGLDISPIKGVLGGIFLLFAGIYLYIYPYRQARLLFKNVRGPPATSGLWGNATEIFTGEPMMAHQGWTDQYGPTFRYPFVLGSTKLSTIDPKVIGMILNDTTTFPKPKVQIESLAKVLGQGILTVQHETHRRQRRVMAPAFGPAAIRALEDIIFDKTILLRNKIADFLEDDSLESSPTPAAPEDRIPGTRKVDIEKYLAELSLDVIGLAGFDYSIDSLTQTDNPLAEAYHRTFSKGQRFSVFTVLQRFFPILSFIPTEGQRLTAEGLRLTEEIGTTIVERKKQDMEKGSTGKDLLSILMKANTSSEIAKEDRMSDAQVMAQITTFMLAGGETSSTALTLCLWRLAQHPEFQTRLRAEIRSVDTDRPTLDTVYKLPFLDNVVRESLRLDPPVPFTSRTTAHDVVIPLSMPIVGRDGTTMDSITVNKDTVIDIPMTILHHNKDTWGPDAREFNPDRWDAASLPKESIQGSVYGQLLTFLAGPRNCIGYRLALAEIKIALFVLIRTFEFGILPSKPKVIRQLAIVQRPVIGGEEEHGNQMPLLVRLAAEE